MKFILEAFWIPLQIVWFLITTAFWAVVYMAFFVSVALILLLGLPSAQSPGAVTGDPFTVGFYMWALSALGYASALTKTRYSDSEYHYRRGLLPFLFCATGCKIVLTALLAFGVLAESDIPSALIGTIVLALFCFLAGIAYSPQPYRPNFEPTTIRGAVETTYEEIKRIAEERKRKRGHKD